MDLFVQFLIAHFEQYQKWTRSYESLPLMFTIETFYSPIVDHETLSVVRREYQTRVVQLNAPSSSLSDVEACTFARHFHRYQLWSAKQNLNLFPDAQAFYSGLLLNEEDLEKLQNAYRLQSNRNT